jgi:hypothetical protein
MNIANGVPVPDTPLCRLLLSVLTPRRGGREDYVFEGWRFWNRMAGCSFF